MSRKNIKENPSSPDYSAVRLFIEKKVTEMHPTPKEIAGKWILKILHKWAGKKLWEEIMSNQRKMELMYKCWKCHFFGYSLETNPSAAITVHFRRIVHEKLQEMNAKSAESRQKYKKKSEQGMPEVFSDDDAVDYYNLQSAKLWNSRTSKKNIAPQKTEKRQIRNPYKKVQKKQKTNSPAVRRVSHDGGAAAYHPSFTPSFVYIEDDWNLPYPTSSGDDE